MRSRLWQAWIPQPHQAESVERPGIQWRAEWQEQEFDEDIIKGVKGYQDCEIIRMKSEDAPKVVKKLRFRNFPSVALFYDGSKKETWKADMDGELDCDNKDIKRAISDLFSGDVF